MRRRAAVISGARLAFAFLAIAAWFSLSNHCALGAVLTTAEPASETSDCPMHRAPAKKKPAANALCCKDVRAVVAKCVSAGAATLRLIRSREYAMEILVRPPHTMREIEGLDTGPPGYFSFAESVLQESLLAHAPPRS